MNDTIICKLCNNKYKALAGHLKSKHGISTYKYKKIFPNSPTISDYSLHIKKTENLKRYEKNCIECNDNFISDRKTTKYCSKECGFKSRNRKITGKCRSKNYKETICPSCKQSKISLIYNSNAKFCNRECYIKHHVINRIEIKCKYNTCNNLIVKKENDDKIYCSRDCYKKDFDNIRIKWDKYKYKKGYYKSLKTDEKYWFDSSFELSRMKQLDLDETVDKWERSKFKIKYIGQDNKEHYYTPDFYILYKNGKEEVEEIKGRLTKKDILKMTAAIPFFNEKGIDYKILQSEDIYNDYIEPIIENYTNSFGSFQRVSMLYSYAMMLKNLSNRSTCLRSQVGCIILPEDLSNIYSIGYNGSKSGDINGCVNIKPGKCGCVHAEINAIHKIESHNIKLKDNSILLCSLAPCFSCSKKIIKYPISKVIYLDCYRDTSGIKLLKANNIEVIKYTELVKKTNNETYQINKDVNN